MACSPNTPFTVLEAASPARPWRSLQSNWTRSSPNDPRARLLEGLEQRVDLLAGEVPTTVDVRELGIEYEVDLWHGQKTGLFLDQRENREAAARYAHGRALDCFCYNGGFALKIASRATSTLAFQSARASM